MKQKNKFLLALSSLICAAVMTATVSLADCFSDASEQAVPFTELADNGNVAPGNSKSAAYDNECERYASCSASETDTSKEAYTENSENDSGLGIGKSGADNGSTAESEAGGEGEKSAGANVFDQVYREICAHSSDMFSALAFAMGLFLTLAYKKKLLPNAKRALTLIQGKIEKLGESVSGEGERAQEKIKDTQLKLEKLGEMMVGMQSGLKSVCERIESLSEKDSDQAAFLVIMKEQIDMLYDIFMSSSLPQYKKDDVGNRINKMKEKLAENE